MHRYFQVSCHGLILTAFFALSLTGRLDFPAIVVFMTCVGVSCYRSIKRLPPPLSARGAFLLSCAYIVFFLADMMIVSRSFVAAAIHLVLFLQIAKLYQEKSDKDYFYLIVLSFLQVLAASSLTIDMSFAATLFLFLVALVSTLMSFDMYRFETKNTVQVEKVAMPLGGMSVWATIWIILTAVILFLAIPRVGTGYFTRAAMQSLLVSGFTDTVQLGEIGQVKRSTAVVMHTRQINGAAFAVLKWRGIALDRFDGHNWSKTDRKRYLLYPSADSQYTIRPVTQARAAARYEIFLEPLATNALFGPHQVRGLSGRLQAIEYDNDDSIYLRFPTARRLQYQVLSEAPDTSRAAGEATAGAQMPEEVRSRYLQLPDDIDPRIKQLADQITSREKPILENASLVESHLKRHYVYTLNLNWKPGPQPLSTFLFDAKTGHCEYFASAMAIILRSAGIPTRLVNGFLRGEYNPVSGDYIVRQSDAHSWVEVFVPGRGWLEFDPTPPDPNQGDMTLSMQLSHYVDAMQQMWNSYIIVYDTSAQLQLFRSAQDSVQSAQASVRDQSERWLTFGQKLSDAVSGRITKLIGSAVFWVALTLLILGATTYKQRRALKTRLQIWRIRSGGGAVNEDVVEQLFYRATRLAERSADARHPAQTWREWIFGLPDPHRRSILTRALIVFEKSKYGQMPVTASDFALLEDTIRALKS
jgi:protein-glutamine gamma-glutamyltransferase